MVWVSFGDDRKITKKPLNPGSNPGGPRFFTYANKTIRSTVRTETKEEAQQRAKHKCPYCNKIAAKRLSVGIWNCPKCDTKFAGKAYTI